MDSEKEIDSEKQTQGELENMATNATLDHEITARGGQYGAHHIDPEIEKRVVRKMDKRIPTLVALLYLLSFLDRSNIGNAKIAGLDKDLNLSSAAYTWLLTIFYIAYICFEFFALMWKLIPPHIWAAIVVTSWGIVATCQAGTNSWAGMMAARFFLGMTEAGFGPGVPYLLSFFYLRHEVGLRIGLFLSAAPLANTFSGALAYGITSGHSKLVNWRLLFLVEGLPSIIGGIAVWFLLPDTPQDSKFLTEEEKAVAKARGVRQAGEANRVGSVNWKHVGFALLDIKNWLTALMYFSTNVSFSSLPVFLPTILQQMGFTAIHAQGLTAPPFFLSFLVTVATTYSADRTRQRGLTVIVLAIIGGIGYIILAAAKPVGVRYFGVFLAAGGIFPVIANILPWVLNNQGSDTKRGMGIVILNLVGQCGPLLGTRLYPGDEGPRFIKGQYVCAAFMFFTAILALALRTLLVWENKKLDRKFGPPVTVLHQEEGEKRERNLEGEENEGPNFRYIL